MAFTPLSLFFNSYADYFEFSVVFSFFFPGTPFPQLDGQNRLLRPPYKLPQGEKWKLLFSLVSFFSFGKIKARSWAIFATMFEPDDNGRLSFPPPLDFSFRPR